METPLQTAERLLAALEDFGRQTGLLLRARQFADAAALMRRASPLVERLASLAPSAPSLRDRVGEFLARQRADLELIAEAIAETKQALSQLDGARVRAQRIAPVYALTANVTQKWLR